MDCIFCENEGQLWMSPDAHYICETVSGFQVFDVRLNQVDWVKCSWFHGGWWWGGLSKVERPYSLISGKDHDLFF